MGSESRKEAFRKYLEASGVLDALTRVLVNLYEEKEKPQIALDFILHSLGGFSNAEFETIKNEKNELKAKFDELSILHEAALKKIEELTPPPPVEGPTDPPPEDEERVVEGKAEKEKKGKKKSK